ncbi:hypothetical protein V6O07_02215 [Arthrospira platensis SPKY2]
MTYIGNVKVKGVKKDKPKLVNEDNFVLPFYQNKKTLKSLDNLNKFIKGVERLVRTNSRYDRYKHWLMEEKGLDFCQIHPNIKADDAPLEMHHGPILTLYDICTIIVNALLERGYKDLTTFKVAKIVLDEHFEHNLPVVMLCEDCHDIFHSGGYIYINPKQSFGNLKRFLKKWRDGIDKEMEMIIEKNLKIAKECESNDNGVLTASAGKSWNGLK